MKLPSVKQAFIWHFSISLLVFIALVALMFKYWFPGELFFMDGGWQGLKIIAPVDLVLGPALTLIFYRPWKKLSHLKIDVTAIATVQILALAFGVYSAYQQRTAAIVFAEDRFETLSYNEFKQAKSELQAEDLPAKPIEAFGDMPILVYAKPFDKEEYGEYLADLLNGLPELRERSDRYSALSAERTEIAKYRVDNKENASPVEILASSPPEVPESGMETYKLKARYANGIISFDGETYKIERNSG